MKNKIGSLGKKLGFKLIVLSIVLLFVGSSFVSSLSHTVDYSNASYFTDDKDTRIRNSKGNYWEATGANFQLAIDDLGVNGGTVDTPNATIDLTTTVWVNNSDVSIIGHGTTLRASQSLPTNGMIRIGGTEKGTADVLIDGVRFNGNQGTVPGNISCHGIFLYYVERVRITNCYFTNISGYSVECYGINDSSIDHNDFRNMGNDSNSQYTGGAVRFESGLYGCFNNIIAYNYVNHTKEHGIKIYPTTADDDRPHNNKVMYNTFRDIGNCNLGNGHTAVIQLHNEGDSAIGNTITLDGWAEEAIQVDNGNNTVSGNTIIIKPGDETLRYGILLLAGSHNTTVTNNKVISIDTSDASGIYILSSRKNIVSDNQLHVAKYPIQLADDGVVITEYNIITNNICSGSKIWLSTGTVENNLFMGNDFTDCTNGVDIDSSGANNFSRNPGYDLETYDTYIHNSEGHYYPNTDDGLQAAITDLASGGTVWLPTDITVDTTITEVNNICIVGAGEKHVTLTAHDDLDAAMFDFSNGVNITIRNIKFDGNKAENTGLYILRFYNFISDITIDNCVFTNSQGNAIYMYDVVNFEITNCDFYGVGVGVDSESIRVRGSVAGANININIFDCYMDNTAGGIYIRYANGSTISRNTIDNCVDIGIFLEDTDNVTIDTNHINGPGYQAIYLTATPIDTIFFCNNLKGTYGVYENSADYSVYVGNNARHCTTGGYRIIATNYNVSGNMGTFV